MLEQITLSYDGQRLPLKAVASTTVRDSQTLQVSAFDAEMVPLIEKALRTSALKLNPQSEGQELVVPVPRPTSETLTAMGKLIKQAGESAKVAVRTARQAAVKQAKALPGKDDQKRAEKQVQTVTDQFIGDIDKACEGKQKELKVLG
eukprot:jgi/Astpho2/3955/Aster-01131